MRAGFAFVLSLVVALQPALVMAQGQPVYRHFLNSGSGSGGTPPGQNPQLPPGQNPQTGSLAVTVPATSISGRTGVDLTVMPSVSGGDGPFQWTVVGTLPDGLTWDPASGRIEGRPSQSGNFPGILFVVADARGAMGQSEPISLGIAAAPSVGVAGSTTAGFGAFVTIEPQIAGVIGPGTWSYSGTLPDGFFFDAATGRISGSSLVPQVASGLRLHVIDSDGAIGTSNQFSIVIGEPLQVVAEGSYQVHLGDPVSITAQYLNTQGDEVFTGPDAQLLPPGLYFDQLQAAILGVPTEEGHWPGLTISATSPSGFTASSAPFAITVIPGSLSASAPGSVTAQVGASSTFAPTLASATGPTPAATWSFIGDAPAWMTVAPATGVVTMTPSATGNASVRLVAQAADGRTASTAAIAVAVIGAPSVSMSAVEAEVGQTVNATAVTANVIGSPTFELIPAALPTGLNFSSSLGRIQGTAQQEAVLEGLTIRMTTANGLVAVSAPFALTVTQPGLTLGVAVPTPPQGQIDIAYLLQPTVTNAEGAVAWTLHAGTLPTGLSVNAGTGAVSGVPSLAGTFPGIQLRAVDDAGKSRTTSPFSITILGAQALAYGTGTATQGESFTLTPSRTNIATPAAYTLASGAMLPGLALSSSNGTISGTPSVSGTTTLAVRVVSANGIETVSGPFTITAAEAPIAISVGSRSAQVTAEFAAVPKLWEEIEEGSVFAVSGSLPPGLGLDPQTGRISGVPTSAGTFSGLRVSVASPSGRTGLSSAFTITVAPAPAVSMQAAYALPVGHMASLLPASTGIEAPAVWTLTPEETLPEGMTFNPETGRIRGAPTTVTGAQTFTLSAVGANGAASNTVSFTISVLETVPQIFAASRYSIGVNHPWSLNITRQDVAEPAAWALTVDSGILPPGLSLASGTGVISGQPTTQGTWSGIRVTAFDALGRVASTTPFSIVVTGAGQASHVAPVTAVVAGTENRTAAERLYDGLTGTDHTVARIIDIPTLVFDKPVTADGVTLNIFNSGASATSYLVQAEINGTWTTVRSGSLGTTTYNGTLALDATTTASRWRLMYPTTAGQDRMLVREMRLSFAGLSPRTPAWTTEAGFIGRTGETVQLSAAARDAWLTEPMRYALVPGHSLPAGSSLSEGGILQIGEPARDNHRFKVRAIVGEDGPSLDREFWVTPFYAYADRAGPSTGSTGNPETTQWKLSEIFHDGILSVDTNTVRLSTWPGILFADPVIADGIYLSIDGPSVQGPTMTIEGRVDGVWTALTPVITIPTVGSSQTRLFTDGPVAVSGIRIKSTATGQSIREFRASYKGQSPITPVWSTPAGYIGSAGDTANLAGSSRNAWINGPMRFRLAPGSALPPGSALTADGVLTLGEPAVDNHHFSVRMADGPNGVEIERAFHLTPALPSASETGATQVVFGAGAPSRSLVEQLYDGINTGTGSEVGTAGTTGMILTFPTTTLVDSVAVSLRNAGTASQNTFYVSAMVNGQWVQMTQNTVNSSATLQTVLNFPTGAAATRSLRFTASSANNGRAHEFRPGRNGNHPLTPVWNTPTQMLIPQNGVATVSASSRNAHITQPIQYALAPGSTLPAGTFLAPDGTVTVGTMPTSVHEFTVTARDLGTGPGIDRTFRVVEAGGVYASAAVPNRAWLGATELTPTELRALYDGNTSTLAQTVTTTAPLEIEFTEPVYVDSLVRTVSGSGTSSTRKAIYEALVGGEWKMIHEHDVPSTSFVGSAASFVGTRATRFRVSTNVNSLRIQEMRFGWGGAAPLMP